MRLGGRLAAAIEVLEDIGRRHRPAADALKDWGLSHRFAGAGDRAAIGNIVYDALRRKRSCGWLLDGETPRALGFGALMLESGETPKTINAAIESDRFAPEQLTAEECAAIAQRRLETAPAAVQADCPDWCASLLEQTFSADWIAETQALAARPPLDLRANTLLSTRDKVLADLAETGAVPADLSRTGVRIPPIPANGRHPNVQAEPSFQKGWFEIQDEGSQVAAELAGVQAGMLVLDYCAGAGGKSLALSAAMENKGQIFAYDSEKIRLAPIFDRIRRAGARNIQVHSRPAELDELRGRMDIVLIDAPCTGSGTWRRRPDAKWRLTQRQLDVRKAEQARILTEASRYVRPGGLLAYVTCSVFREENSGQIEAFVQESPQFGIIDPAARFETRFPGALGRVRTDGIGMILSPLRSGTDGFYFAALQRRA